MKGDLFVKLLEPIGLFLVLISVFWKVFLVDEVKKIDDGVWKAQLEGKIDNIFFIVKQHYRSDHPEVSTRSSAINLDGIEAGWVFAGKHSVDKQTKVLSRIQ